MKNFNCMLAACAITFCSLSEVAAQAEDTPLQSVPQLDLSRYLGTWYEIALYPNVFQRMCVAQTQAQYAKLPDGQIEVRNRCTDANGKTAEVAGRARLASRAPDALSSQLKVRFAPDWLAWAPFVWANYWVIQLADDYRYAVVSEPGRDYLWVLSRTPTLAAPDKEVIFERLRMQGLDPGRLQFTPQAAAKP
jgi:apolipoprotein D and lipocalin family protein